MTAFVRNQWYVAAYAHEVDRDLLARTILGEPIVLFRAESGEAVALADRCVHRRYPLSQSRLVDDTIVCGYHGFTYDTTGTCVFVPGQNRIPRTTRWPVTRWWSRTRSSGCGSASRTAPTAPRCRGRSGWPTPATRPSAGWNRSRRDTTCSWTT